MEILLSHSNSDSKKFAEIFSDATSVCIFADQDKLPINKIGIVVDLLDDGAEEKSKRLHKYANNDSIFLCSTLCCTATDIMGKLNNKVSVVGINGLTELWMVGKTIEISSALQCPKTSLDNIEKLINRAGFNSEIVEDRVALVSPRILSTLINEAAFSLIEKAASAEDIDAAMKLGVNYPKGLLEWADELGLDRVVKILDALHNEYHQERYRACVLLRQLVRAGYLGRSSGRGFYFYE